MRVAIGHSGGGPTDDLGAVATPAPVTPPGADPPLVPDSFTGPATDADTVRFLEQASWGPTPAEIARVKAMGFMAYLNEQFNLPPANAGKGFKLSGSDVPARRFYAAMSDEQSCRSKLQPGGLYSR